LKFDESHLIDAAVSLENQGFWVSPIRVTESHLNEFVSAAKLELCNILGSEQESDPQVAHKSSAYAAKDMIFLGSDWVLSQELTYLMAMSPGILNIVGNYLKVEPILNLPESWFSFPVEALKVESAQNWHVDCDRVKWIKVFVYLTDVGEDNGPHSFVAKSHKNWRLPVTNSRFTNDQVLSKFFLGDLKTFVAQKGTVIFEDTRGIHKGSRLNAGYRFILQLEFSTDSFGYIHPVFVVPRKFAKLVASNPLLFPKDRFSISM
jgi:hypothetical protein